MSVSEDQYEMLYCDRTACRVNTFERGEDEVIIDGRRRAGRCPGCGSLGLPLGDG